LSTSSNANSIERIVKFPEGAAGKYFVSKDFANEPSAMPKIPDGSEIGIPPGFDLIIKMNYNQARDISWMEDMKSNDIQSIVADGASLEDNQLHSMHKLTGLKKLDIRSMPLHDKQIGDLVSHLPNLLVLQINRTSITDGVMPYIAKLKDLYTLDLSHSKITSKGIAYLIANQKLRHLDASKTQIDNSVASTFAKIPSLRNIDVGENKGLTDEVVSFLPHTKYLSSLDLGHTAITDKTLAALAKMPTLRSLNLQGTAITDDGLKLLLPLHLSELNISHTAISDRSVKTLQALKLQKLKLDSTKISRLSIIRMTESMPKCNIEYEP
jgi:Leucine-rich repeat (LRR) protein